MLLIFINNFYHKLYSSSFIGRSNSLCTKYNIQSQEISIFLATYTCNSTTAYPVQKALHKPFQSIKS